MLTRTHCLSTQRLFYNCNIEITTTRYKLSNLQPRLSWRINSDAMYTITAFLQLQLLFSLLDSALATAQGDILHLGLVVLLFAH